MKGQQLFNSFLPGVTVAVLTAHPALAGNIHDGVEVDSSSDTTNISHATSNDRHDRTFTQKPYSRNDISIPSNSIDWNRVKAKSTKTKTILSRVPRIKKSGNITAIEKQKPLSRSIFTHNPNVRVPTSKPELARSKKDLQRDSPTVLNVSQRTGGLTSSLQTSSLQTSSLQTNSLKTNSLQTSSVQINNCGASALLSYSGKCERASMSTKQKVIRSVPVSVFPSSGVGEQNSAKIRKSFSLANNSLVNKLQRLKRVADRKSSLEFSRTESNPLELSAKVQLAQTNPEEATPPATQPNSQETTPPTTQPNPGEATPLPNTTPTPGDDFEKPQFNPNIDLNSNPNPLIFPSKPEEVKVKATQPITLQQALDLARQNNRDLQEFLLVVKRARSVVRQQQASLFPQLDLTTGLQRSQSSSGQLSVESGQIGATDEPIPTTFTGQLELTYNLYTSGARLAAIRAAEEQLKIQELELERISEEVRLNVSTDYYNLQEADEQVRIQRSAVENGRASLRDAEAQERAGIGTRFAVLQSRADLARTIQQLNNAISQQIQSRSVFVQRLSIPQSVNVVTADPVKLAGLWNRSLEESVVLALQNRPELQRELAQRNVNEQNRRAALAQLGPRISLIGTYDLLDQFDDSVGVTDGYSVRLQGTLSLFDGGAARAQAKQEKANIAIAENNFAQQREQIRSDVEQAYAQLESNLKNIETSNLGLEEARESLRLARLRFQAGVGTQTDVIREQNALTAAEGNRVSAILGYNRALASLQRAITSRGLTATSDR